MSQADPSKKDPQVDVIVMSPGALPVEKQLGFWAHGVVIENLTNQWLFVREAFAFVAPYLVGRQIPLGGMQKVSVSFQAPVGFTSTTQIPGQLAVIRFTEASVPAAPGVPVAPATLRWTVIHQPGLGVTASVTRSAIPGIVHVWDAATFSYDAGTGAAFSGVTVGVLRDGPSAGGSLLTAVYASEFTTQGVAGDKDVRVIGPGLGIKCTVGNAATIEFAAGVANYIEGVTAVGYDQ